ncbi:hypothetical protein CBR67_12780 [Bordetella hinzii]|uniref:glycosyltransferase family 2 protein n=1 Tax=Bordetella hinzii TaxID=103855 RepID=UPI0011503636|nr:glycosyltransferase family A protein [Bordetella hinzii]QDJ37462.1 hypothetical protein CBR67_12780 [Bordetella hinzii]
MFTIRKYFKPKRSAPIRGRSSYHDLALGISKCEPVPELLKRCLQLGLRDRACRLVESYKGDLPAVSLLRLALMRGDIASARQISYAHLASDRINVDDANEIAMLMAAVDSALVYELARMYPRQIVCSVALRQRAADGQDWSSLKFPKPARLGPDFFLINCNAHGALTKKLGFFADYLRAFNLPVYLSPITDYQLGSKPEPINLKPRSRCNTDVPLVSVIMAVRNCAPYIKTAIYSLLNQSYQALEVLVVDDASTDDTVDVLTSHFAHNSRVKIFALSENVGTYEAKNIALREARGEYVTFQDGDDWSHPQRIEICSKELTSNNEILFVSHLYVRVSKEGDFYSSKVWPFTRWTPNSVFFRRSRVLEKGLEFDRVKVGGDSEFMARMKVVFGERAHLKIRKPLMYALHRPDSLMSASATGLDRNGYSKARTDYQQIWSERLIAYAARELDVII